VACDEGFTAYSCGGSRGVGEVSPHRIPFSSHERTVMFI
jgi:hypothetical protein